MRILFWGTPDFALPSLAALAPAGHDVVGVVTRPSRPKGRGRKTGPTPVKEFAQTQGYPVLAPESPRDDLFEKAARRMRPDVSVVVAYGRILPSRVLDIPPLGSVNVHASLLPALRGAAPVNWAVALGHDETGVTIMRMVKEMDAGPILAQAPTPIGPEDTGSSLSSRLSEIGAQLLVKTLAELETGGRAREVEQDHGAATYAPKVDRKSARIDWTRSARSVANLIRGMDAVPGAWTLLAGQPVKLFRPVVLADGRDGAGAASTEPGRMLSVGGEPDLVVATGGGAVGIREVQPAGKRRMASVAWLRGRGASQADRFE